MTWLTSLFVGVLSAGVGLLVSGFVASLAVDWYRVSSFEGGSGYFVVGLALVGGIAAFVMGLVAARVLASGVSPSFMKALGVSIAIVLIANGAIAGVARVLAHIPPEIDGEELLLHFELMWPESEKTDPRTRAGLPRAWLGTGSGNAVGKQEEGVFLVEDAQLREGRWTAPGAVRVFTSRGKRFLLIEVGGESAGFIVPLPSHPGQAERIWSEWLPHARDGAPPLADGFRYRFRVVRTSEPFRIQTSGPFEIATSATYFFDTGESERRSARSVMHVTLGGKVIEGLGGLSAVAVVPGPKPALVVAGDSLRGRDGASGCLLLVAEGDSLARRDAGSCHSNIAARYLTNDPQQFADSRAEGVPRGWLDRRSFSRPGLYRLDGVILDTRTLEVAPFAFPPDTYPPEKPGIFGVSPDGRSVVYLLPDEETIGVTDYVANRSYTVAIDRTRMRYGAADRLDPAWLAHHFTWVRSAGGTDSLVARTDFIPLPHSGVLTLGKPGEYQSWSLSPGSEEIRDFVIEALVSQLGGQLLPQRETSVSRQVRIDGKEVDVFLHEREYVNVSMYSPAGDPALMARIAAALDGVLATGKYDALLRREREDGGV